jgi:hypothetical protein
MYVRKTMTLVEDIRNSVDSMKHKQIDKLYKGTSIELDTPLHHEVRKVIEKVLWKEAPDLMDKMPEKWCKMEDSVQVIFQYEPPSNSTNIQFEVSNEDKLKLPPTYSRYGRDCVIGKSDATPLIKEWLAGIKDEDSAKRETKDMFDGIKEQLTSFMGKHASLNTAIKELPELEMYVPQDYLNKLAEETVRTKPQKQELDDDDDDVKVDVEAITRAAIAHRITSSGE